MQAMVIQTFGEGLALQMQTVPSLALEAYEVKVQIKAAGVNQADLLQAQGKYPAPAGYPPNILGLEFAGIVEQIGSNVQKFKPGDRVFGLTGGGAYAQEINIHADCVTKIPDNISFIEAAACPEALITAYDALVLQMNLSMGESLLISAVGSGVGLAALQIAKTIGVTVIGTSRSAEKLNKACSLGLDHGLHVEDGKFSTAIKEIFPDGINVILELVGGDYLIEDIDCTASKGRISLVGLLAGRKANIDLGKVLSKRLLIKGTTLRARSLAEKMSANQVLEKNLTPLIATGSLKPVINEIFPLKEAKQALKYLASGANFGKIVLDCG